MSPGKLEIISFVRPLVAYIQSEGLSQTIGQAYAENYNKIFTNSIYRAAKLRKIYSEMYVFFFLCSLTHGSALESPGSDD